jgi:hypothetical protein
VLTVATAAFAALLLGLLAGLGRPPAGLTSRDLPAAAGRGVVVLSRLSDRRRERLRPPTRTSASIMESLHGAHAQQTPRGVVTTP